jgi:hypothetical protein
MESPGWHELDDEPLLDRKISSLGLSLPGTPLQPLIQQLYDELTAKSSSGWLCAYQSSRCTT